MSSIIGRKLGMTSIFDKEADRQLTCTIIEAGPCVVTQVRSVEKDGYTAYQLGFGDKKEKRANKSERGHFALSATAVKQHTCEFGKNKAFAYKLGDVVDCSVFGEGDEIEVIGTSKGKGFQGVVKRHGFSGVGEASHGQHDRQRAPGSVGGSSFPSRVFKGLRMAGRTGGERVKVKGLRVLKIFPDKNYLLVSGSVPGAKGSVVYINKH